MLWRRPTIAEATITRDEVYDMFTGLADIYATTLDIRRILVEEDDEETQDDA